MHLKNLSIFSILLFMLLQLLQRECPLPHSKTVLFLPNSFEQPSYDDWHLRALFRFSVLDFWVLSIFIRFFHILIFLSLIPWRNCEFTVSMFALFEWMIVFPSDISNELKDQDKIPKHISFSKTLQVCRCRSHDN